MNFVSDDLVLYTSRARNLNDQKTKEEKNRRVREVLIVDDEEPLLLSIAEGLSIYKKYFNLQTALNGADAIKILKSSFGVDLVVTDLSMPKMDGFELLAYMNRNYPHIPVILMTAFGTPKIEEIVNGMGLLQYLEKPLDIDSIADNIFTALSIKVESGELKRKESSGRQKGFTGRISELIDAFSMKKKYQGY